MQRAAASTLGVRLQDCASHCVTALRGSRLSHDSGRSCEADAHGRAPRDEPASASPPLSKAAWGPAGTAVPPKVPWKRHARPCPTTALIVIRTGDRAGAQPPAERLAAAARPRVPGARRGAACRLFLLALQPLLSRALVSSAVSQPPLSLYRRPDTLQPQPPHRAGAPWFLPTHLYNEVAPVPGWGSARNPRCCHGLTRGPATS